MKTRIEELVLSLKSKGELTATAFFVAARKTPWGKDSQTLVEDYNEQLGRMFGRSQLTIHEVQRAMEP